MAGPQEGEQLQVEDVGPSEASRGWQFSVDWKTYEVPHANVQEYEGAELTLGPMPERRHEKKVRCSHVWKLLPSGSEAGPHLPTPGSAPGPPGPLGPAASLLPSSGLDTKWPQVGLVPLPLCMLPCSQPQPRPPGQGLCCEGVDALSDL